MLGDLGDEDFILCEIGGTVGDIESLPFLEAIRQLGNELGPERSLFVHLTLVPYIAAAAELKTKPTQHSVKELQSVGIQPDLLLCRSDRNCRTTCGARSGSSATSGPTPSLPPTMFPRSTTCRSGTTRTVSTRPCSGISVCSANARTLTCRAGSVSPALPPSPRARSRLRSSASTRACPTPTSRLPKPCPTAGSSTRSGSRSTGSIPRFRTRGHHSPA